MLFQQFLHHNSHQKCQSFHLPSLPRQGSAAGGPAQPVRGRHRWKKNSLELSAALCYPLDRKRRLLVTGTPIGAPLQRWSIPSKGSYLSVRGAHPGCNRVGIIFFACGPCLCRERQATL